MEPPIQTPPDPNQPLLFNPDAPVEDPNQALLFDCPADWREDWKGMPEFEQKNQDPWQTILVHFKDRKDRDDFAKVIGQKLTDVTQSFWHPKLEFRRVIGVQSYVSEKAQNPRYPIYVISKGRWESRLTSKALEAINVPYRIVIEPQELVEYEKVIDREKILVLPFSNLGQGSIPARNWVWEHSIKEGHERHWILDDNIRIFFRLTENIRMPVSDGTIFRAAEDFVERYENVAQAGFQYRMFAPPRSERLAPFALNTRIYSCILIKNDVPQRWRGRYNEDTDLSIRLLKDGWCTVLFYAFLCDKNATMAMKGGNTESLYKINEGGKDGRLLMAESLRDQHPDIVKITWKWDRYQHQVDYSAFKRNKLVPKPGVAISETFDNYGMKLDTVSA